MKDLTKHSIISLGLIVCVATPIVASDQSAQSLRNSVQKNREERIYQEQSHDYRSTVQVMTRLGLENNNGASDVMNGMSSTSNDTNISVFGEKIPEVGQSSTTTLELNRQYIEKPATGPSGIDDGNDESETTTHNEDDETEHEPTPTDQQTPSEE